MSSDDVTRTRPISGRIAEADYDFLIAYQMDGKVTASEKLRYVAGFFRRYHESFANYHDALAEIQRLLEPTRLNLKQLEHEQDIRSQFLDQVFLGLPELMAQLLATRSQLENTADPQVIAAARKLETGVLQTLLHLLESTLRLALTSKSPCYHPHLLDTRLDTITELVALLRKNPPESHPQ